MPGQGCWVWTPMPPGRETTTPAVGKRAAARVGRWGQPLARVNEASDR